MELNQHLDVALKDINEIRGRAGIKLLTAGDLTLDKVRHERKVELAFEKHRYWDLKRWRLAAALAEGQSAAIYDVCSKTMGGVGIALAMIGVVICPITLILDTDQLMNTPRRS